MHAESENLIPTEVPRSVLHEVAPDAAIEIEAPERRGPPTLPPIVNVEWLDWHRVRTSVDPGAVRLRIRVIVERVELLLDRESGPGMLFDNYRADTHDRAILVSDVDENVPLWFIGDLHGDLLALEAALETVRAAGKDNERARLVFLGDLFDDGGFGLEVLLRFLELVAEDPSSVCIVAGNHDEALGHDGTRFTATVSPSDFAEFLNAHLEDDLIVRTGKLAVRLFAQAPRALFFPDGLLVAHGGFPLSDLHDGLREHRDWNEPQCLSDFVWTRAHPKARRKLPNRHSRGSQFGYEDFAEFCATASAIGRPVTHMVRGHDHVDERWAVFPAYEQHPVLTTVALSRRLARETFGPLERIPTIARWTPGELPQVHRLMVPGALVREFYPADVDALTDGGDS